MAEPSFSFGPEVCTCDIASGKCGVNLSTPSECTACAWGAMFLETLQGQAQLLAQVPELFQEHLENQSFTDRSRSRMAELLEALPQASSLLTETSVEVQGEMLYILFWMTLRDLKSSSVSGDPPWMFLGDRTIIPKDTECIMGLSCAHIAAHVTDILGFVTQPESEYNVVDARTNIPGATDPDRRMKVRKLKREWLPIINNATTQRVQPVAQRRNPRWQQHLKSQKHSSDLLPHLNVSRNMIQLILPPLALYDGEGDPPF